MNGAARGRARSRLGDPLKSPAIFCAYVQSTLPVILPVIDYAYTFEQPVFNGELSSRAQPAQPLAQRRSAAVDHAAIA